MVFDMQQYLSDDDAEANPQIIAAALRHLALCVGPFALSHDTNYGEGFCKLQEEAIKNVPSVTLSTDGSIDGYLDICTDENRCSSYDRFSLPREGHPLYYRLCVNDQTLRVRELMVKDPRLIPQHVTRARQRLEQIMHRAEEL